MATVFKSPQWLMPTEANQDNVSNYSMTFDGVDDRMDITTISLGTTQSLSWWIYRNSYLTQEAPFGDTTSGLADILVYMNGQDLYYRVGSTNSAWSGCLTSVLTNQKWCNIIITRNGATVKAFINGSLIATNTLTGGDESASVQLDRVGASSAGTPAYFVNGKMDEVAVWTSDQSANASAIYNSGTPTTISGAVAHWKMGEDATFSTNWTVPDQVASNDGTSANMTVEDRVGDAPNSTSNAVSFNMVEADRETDTP
tara:strand:- start:332 stop:1099 length:768 start_codon:yes stop_codon:yes gene_type:complete